jgi:phosphoglycolate phosphatase/putative hydrolase of the HAD superfamily
VKEFRLPERIAALIFDMDSTLYTNPPYARFQIDCIIRRLGDLRGKSFEEMEAEVAARRAAWADAHGGRATSLGNILACLGVSVEESVRWREELIEPGRYLKADPKLREALGALAASFPLALVTNNPVLVARKTLSALGAEDLFRTIVGMDTCGVSKPHPAPFLKAAESLGLPPPVCVSIGDRYEVDIALPLELGMGGILVGGVEDVYELPRFFCPGFPVPSPGVPRRNVPPAGTKH